MLVFMHSCGHIADLLDSFIEAGLDVLETAQQENMGIDNLKERFGGRLCFWCSVDIQKTMITGTDEEIQKYARHLIDSFGSYNGGFMAKWYEAHEAVGHDMRRVETACRAFREYGDVYYK